MDDDDSYPVECPKCGGMALYYQCWNGCDDGEFDAYEEDPLWYDPGDMETCSVCRGAGGWTVCQACGYDSEKAEAAKRVLERSEGR